MKKRVLSIFLVITINIVRAQASLEFNQVKLITTVETVPLGKAWKVESVASNSNQALPVPGLCSTLNNSTQIAVNGTTIHISARYVYNGSNCYGSSSAGIGVSTTGDLTNLPLWLPANTTLAAGLNVAFISIIEFNIVP